MADFTPTIKAEAIARGILSGVLAMFVTACLMWAICTATKVVLPLSVIVVDIVMIGILMAAIVAVYRLEHPYQTISTWKRGLLGLVCSLVGIFVSSQFMPGSDVLTVVLVIAAGVLGFEFGWQFLAEQDLSYPEAGPANG